MDSSPVLRQQSQNKILKDQMRLQKDVTKMSADPKVPQSLAVLDLSKKDVENRDPRSTGNSQKTSVRPAISRLPVLIKSQRLQAPSTFSLSHSKWEENPLAGKTKRKKPCTKPVPFNLSNPKKSVTTQRLRNSAPSTAGTQPTCPEKISCASHLEMKHTIRKPQSLVPNAQNTELNMGLAAHLAKAPHLAKRKANAHTLLQSNSNASMGTEQSRGHQSSSVISLVPAIPKRVADFTGRTLQDSKQYDYSSKCVTNPVSNSISNKSGTNQPLKEPVNNDEDCLKNMDLLSLKDQPQTLLNNLPQQFTPGANSLKGSIGSLTPQSSQPYNNMPQRVSIMKSHQKTSHLTGPGRSVHFSPDPAALCSILQNEGVRAGGLSGASPLSSARPSGRNTSIYTAQRVPVKKCRTGAAAEPMGARLKETLQFGTPLRVPNTAQRMSLSAAVRSHKRLLSTYRSPHVPASGVRAPQDLHTQQKSLKEEVVQRLFNDQDDEEQSGDQRGRCPGTQLKQPVDRTPPGGYGESHKEKEEEEEQRSKAREPFIQVPHRESVIHYSVGKKQLRTLCSEVPQPLVPSQRAASPQHTEKPCQTDPERPVSPSAPSQPRDISFHKSCGLSKSVALLRKRLTALEDLRLDEEVASFTSAPPPYVPLTFQRPRPCCLDPVASTLYFQESTRFMAICLDPSPDSSTCPSPFRQR